jgi:hypothetical protein
MKPEDEAFTYHDSGRIGFFAILADSGNGRKNQTPYRLTDMPKVLQMVDPTRDTWLSQAEFIKPNRRVVNLARIGLLFADLDTYRKPWATGRSPDQLANTVLYFCAQDGIPPPSLLIYSGRGLQAKWLLDGTIPRQALPRWNACQTHLIDRLAELGADVAAKDASRVLRLVNTVNSKSKEICRVIHIENSSDGQPVRYSFEYLTETFLPVARWDIEKSRQGRIEKKKGQFKIFPGGKSGNLRSLSPRQLAWDRMEDLRFLSKLRGGVEEGERMKHLFWRLNFLLLSGATNSAQMYHEAAALARELDSAWGYRSKELMTLYSKARAYEAGERVVFGGRQYSPLYTPRNDTLINLFGITDDEQRSLRTIITKDIAGERHRDRERARRRAAGAVDRTIYIEKIQESSNIRRVQAQSLRSKGLSVRAIASQMGVSIGSVSGYVKALKGVQ